MNNKNELPPGWGEQSADENPWANSPPNPVQTIENTTEPPTPAQSESVSSGFPSIPKVNMPNLSIPNIPKPKLPTFPKKSEKDKTVTYSEPQEENDVAEEMPALFEEESVSAQPTMPTHTVESVPAQSQVEDNPIRRINQSIPTQKKPSFVKSVVLPCSIMVLLVAGVVGIIGYYLHLFGDDAVDTGGTSETGGEDRTSGADTSVTKNEATRSGSVTESEPSVVEDEDESWRELYAEVLKGEIPAGFHYFDGAYTPMFNLYDLNGDGTPELIWSSGSFGASNGGMYTVKDGKLITLREDREGGIRYGINYTYDPNTGYLIHCGGPNPFAAIYKIENYELVQVVLFGTGENEFYINRIQVTEEEYRAEYSKYDYDGISISYDEYYITESEIQRVIIGDTTLTAPVPCDRHDFGCGIWFDCQSSVEDAIIPVDNYYAITTNGMGSVDVYSEPDMYSEFVANLAPNGYPIVIWGYNSEWYEIACDIEGEIIWGFLPRDLVSERRNWSYEDYMSELERFGYSGSETSNAVESDNSEKSVFQNTIGMEAIDAFYYLLEHGFTMPEDYLLCPANAEEFEVYPVGTITHIGTLLGSLRASFSVFSLIQ